MNIVKTFNAEKLVVNIYNSREKMGTAAASDVADRIKKLLSAKSEINIVFAAAPSQNEFLDELIKVKDIEWRKINAFHLDEYIGLAEDAPQRFGRYLYDRIFSKVPFNTINYLNGNAEDIEAECDRYAELIKSHPIDIACIGIGENGHIAFNDPPVADFNDKFMIKKVKLDNKCRMQQVHDGCFESIDKVPEYALTMTVPAIFAAKYIFCIVPGSTKAEAVRKAVEGPIEETCPASILRRHENAGLYLDRDAATLLNKFW